MEANESPWCWQVGLRTGLRCGESCWWEGQPFLSMFISHEVHVVAEAKKRKF